GGVEAREAMHESAKLFEGVRLDSLVGIEPEDPVTGGMGKRFIAGGGEVVRPGEIKDPGAELPGNVRGAVGRSGVDGNDFVKQLMNGVEALRQILPLVFDDHAQ